MQKATGLSMLALLVGLQLAVIAGPVETAVAKTESSMLPNSTWIKWATNAWRYYGPSTDLGVDPTTGLPIAGRYWPYFTFWDLGTYLYAIMDVSRLGILGKTGLWGSDDRINKVINWLQTCTLTTNQLPYLWYNARTGNPGTEVSSEETNVSDYGQFLIAMHRLKTFRPDLITTIDNLVKVRFNTALMAGSSTRFSQAGTGIYAWYVSQGFMYFGYDSYTPVLEAMKRLKQMMDGPKVTVYGITLPRADLTSEPLQLGMFFADPNPQLAELTRNAYLAQEKRYNATGKYQAWTEGNTGLANPNYVYEWIVTSGGGTWVITPSQITPIAYLRTAIAYEALSHTTYTRSMIDYLNTTLGGPTEAGYEDGVDESGRQVNTIVDRTNGMIIGAARFAYDVSQTPLLTNYPQPFISAGNLDAIFIVADTVPHGPTGWRAYTWDNMGAIGAASKLGRASTSGNIRSLLDTWVTTYSSSTGEVKMTWAAADKKFISIGSHAVNTMAYEYERFNAIPFYMTWPSGLGIGDPVLHSELTRNNYTFTWGSIDYALIAFVYDARADKTMLHAWGITAYGTVAASMVLQYYDSTYSGVLQRPGARAIIIKWTDTNTNGNVDPADQITVIETW